mmetsp:Transcript_6803/g.7384  ORF Transcript_6803/g.7384 Transcript_6803/m.7384 type:complete len:482 (-) Transcript_6803:45-1490(-)
MNIYHFLGRFSLARMPLSSVQTSWMKCHQQQRLSSATALFVHKIRTNSSNNVNLSSYSRRNEHEKPKCLFRNNKLKNRRYTSNRSLICTSMSQNSNHFSNNPTTDGTSTQTTPSSDEIQKYLSSNDNSDDGVTIYHILKSSIEILEKYSAPEPIQSACHLLSYTLQDDFKWEDNGFSVLLQIYEHQSNNRDGNQNYNQISGKKITIQELTNYSHMLERRINKEPLQYIIGQWDFYNCIIKTRKPCLCPRPETEELVDYVVKDIKKILYERKEIEKFHHQHNRNNDFKKEKIRLLDVGSGTGAIGIAIAKEFSPSDVEVIAIDVQQEAIQLCVENGLNILGETQTQYESILCSANEFTNDNCSGEESKYKFGFDIVVSNPPYIPRRDMETLTDDVVGYEDYGALCGGDDGMDVIRDIVERLHEWCNENAICWMEVDTSHPKLMSAWISNKSEEIKGDVEFLEDVRDMYGLDRFVRLRINKPK